MLSQNVKKNIINFLKENGDNSAEFWDDVQFEAAAKVFQKYNPEVLVEPAQQVQVSTIDSAAAELERLIAQARQQPPVWRGTLPQYRKIPSIV